MVRVTPITSVCRKRLGMFEGVFTVPKDLDTPFKQAIETLFGA